MPGPDIPTCMMPHPSDPTGFFGLTPLNASSIRSGDLTIGRSISHVLKCLPLCHCQVRMQPLIIISSTGTYLLFLRLPSLHACAVVPTHCVAHIPYDSTCFFNVARHTISFSQVYIYIQGFSQVQVAEQSLRYIERRFQIKDCGHHMVSGKYKKIKK